MSIERTRLAVVLILVVALAIGGYVAWHATHQGGTAGCTDANGHTITYRSSC